MVFAIFFLQSCKSSKSSSSSLNNMVFIMQVNEPIPGVCDNSKVYALFPLQGNGQVKAEPSMSKDDLQKQLNESVSYLKENPRSNEKGMVRVIINCKGEMVDCSIDNKTSSPELDEQILAVFSELKDWKAGTIHNKAVDSIVMYSFNIKNGILTL